MNAPGNASPESIHPFLSVVVNYNAGALLQQCVQSLLDAVPEGLVVIVDNDSRDNSLDFLQSAQFKDAPIWLRRNTRNLGFSIAVNQGLQAANAHYSLVINPDCICTPESIADLCAALRANPQAGMAGPMLLNLNGTEQAGGRRAIPTPWRSLVRVLKLSFLAKRYPRLFSDFLLHHQPIPLAPCEVEAISGACMLVKREALIDVGLLDEGYFMHCEDLDWCMRFRQNDWTILFVPQAQVTHALGVCSRSRPLFVEWHKHKGMLRFYRKFFRHQYPGALMWLVILGVWLRFAAVAAYHLVRSARRRLGLLHG